MTDQLATTTTPSPVGELTLVASDAGLCAVLWPSDEGRVSFDAELRADASHPVLMRAARQLGEYFAGTRQTFDLPLDLRGTEFQVSVWEALAEIDFGETSTYGAQAQAIGNPAAVRAVGAANGKNPVSIVLPCHRIVGKDGSLTGFAGGLDAKRYLLDHEQAQTQLPL
jgi:methylated-DNA-[protein]-cysteine S-methyltransferase